MKNTYFFIFAIFFCSSCIYKQLNKKSVDYSLHPDIQRLAESSNALIISCDDAFIGLRKLFSYEIPGFSGGDYWNIITDRGLKYTTYEGEGLYNEHKRQVFEIHAPEEASQNNLYIIPMLLFYPSNELSSWGYEVYYCENSDSFVYICNYLTGQDFKYDSRNTVAVYHASPPRHIHYFIRVFDTENALLNHLKKGGDGNGTNLRGGKRGNT